MRQVLVLAVVLLTAGCERVEESREIGHKGRARLDPYLAATRFLEEFGYRVESVAGWPRFDEGLTVAILPASALGAKGYVTQLDEWVRDGGHAIVLLEKGEGHRSDWSRSSGGIEVEFSEGFEGWLSELGIETDPSGEDEETTEVKVGGETFEVWMESSLRPEWEDQAMLLTRRWGEGLVSVMADARPFRNRYIGDHDHAALLLALVEASPYHRRVVFVRSAGLSFGSLLWEKGWAALIALLVLVALWLWKNLPRFGPLDSKEDEGTLRAYDHHLEALGDFQWRLDRGEGLLRPLREAVLERAHRLAISSGHPEDDVFSLMGQRAGITRERAQQAMTIQKPRDPAAFTRVVADLQSIHLSLP